MPHEPLEERMMSEYVRYRLRGIRTHVHLRLGMPPGVTVGGPNWEWERKVKMPRLPEADLVYQEGADTWILEFKISRFQAAAGMLQYYRQELQNTPGFLDVDPEKIRLKIVFGRRDPMAEEFVKTLGIEVEHYQPDWLKDAILARPWLR